MGGSTLAPATQPVPRYIVCPHNIIAAGATIGLSGRERDVLRRTLAPALLYALLGGLLALFVFA